MVWDEAREFRIFIYEQMLISILPQFDLGKGRAATQVQSYLIGTLPYSFDDYITSQLVSGLVKPLVIIMHNYNNNSRYKGIPTVWRVISHRSVSSVMMP